MRRFPLFKENTRKHRKLACDQVSSVTMAIILNKYKYVLVSMKTYCYKQYPFPWRHLSRLMTPVSLMEFL